MLFYFDFQNYFKMLRLASRETSLAIRVYYLSMLLIWVPLVSSFHAICFFLDGIIFPKLHSISLQQPIFMIGHARSGTTLTHRLLSQDESRFSTFKLYELFFPSLLQKKIIRGLAKLDSLLFFNAIGKIIQLLENRNYKSGAHEMRLNSPEEDDIIFFFSMASGYWITKMPYMGELDFYHVDNWPKKKRDRLMGFYSDCVRRQLYLNGIDKTHLSKNPIFSGRVSTLIENFPDARFIINVRSPKETIPSLLKLLDGAYRSMGWDDERRLNCLKVLAEQSFDSYMRPLEFLENNPKTPGSIVNYSDLVNDAERCIKQVYKDLGIDLPDNLLPSLQNYAKEQMVYSSSHKYSLAEFGLDPEEIEKRLDNLFVRFQWERHGSKKSEKAKV